MQVNEIRDIKGNLIEYTTIETIESTTHYKRYDGQGVLLEEWTEPYIMPEPTEKERLEATEKALLDLMEVLANV